MDDIWTRYNGRGFVDTRIRTWWLFGKYYLEPLVQLYLLRRCRIIFLSCRTESDSFG